jgi:hypothetical protein
MRHSALVCFLIGGNGPSDQAIRKKSHFSYELFARIFLRASYDAFIMKTLSLLLMTALATAQSKDVWYDAAGQPVKTTIADSSIRLQPHDLIAGQKPLQRAEASPWDKSLRQRRVRTWQGDGWMPWSYWGLWPVQRVSYCPHPLPTPRPRGNWCFSYQSPGISVNWCR